MTPVGQKLEGIEKDYHIPPPQVGSTDFLYSNEHLIEISMLITLKVSEIIEEKINVVGVVVYTSDNFFYF